MKIENLNSLIEFYESKITWALEQIEAPLNGHISVKNIHIETVVAECREFIILLEMLRDKEDEK